MASYAVVSQRPTVQVLSGGNVADVQEVGFVTSPSGVYGQTEVPRSAWLAEGSDTWIQPIAQAIEDLISGGLASYMTFVQDVDPVSGLLVGYYDVTVTYDPGDGRPVQVGSVRVSLSSLTLDTGFGSFLTPAPGQATGDPVQLVRDAYDALVATANL